MTGNRKKTGVTEDMRPEESGAEEECHPEDVFEKEDEEYGYDRDFEFPEDDDDGQYDNSFFRPMQSRKAWAILAGILVVIAVSVLYVYQTGDTKTILGNQPIPRAQSNLVATPVAANVPMGGAVNIPLGGVVNAQAGGGLFGHAPQTQVARPAPGAVRCPNCSAGGIPVCSGCGAAMQPLDTRTGTYVCPSCGRVGVPICPRCGGHMSGFGQVRK